MTSQNIYAIHSNSVLTIAVRETMSRYGRDNLGFLWALVEPMLLAAGVMVVWSAIKSPYEHGVAIMSLVFTGYLPLTMWRHMTIACIGLFHQTRSLLYHDQVSLMDIVVARLLMELAACTVAALFIFFVLRVFGMIEPFERIDLVVFGWLLMFALSAGFGLLFASLTTAYREFDRFIATFLYVTLPISGFMFLQDWLPQAARDAFYWVPWTHCYEMIRAGALGGGRYYQYDAPYVLLWAAVTGISGLLMMRMAHEEVAA